MRKPAATGRGLGLTDLDLARLLRLRHGHPDEAVADDDPVDGARVQRDAGDDAVGGRVDSEDRRVDTLAIGGQHAQGGHPYRAGAEGDSHRRQGKGDPLHRFIRLRIDPPDSRGSPVCRTPLARAVVLACDYPNCSSVRCEPGRLARDLDPMGDASRLRVDPDDDVAGRIGGPDRVARTPAADDRETARGDAVDLGHRWRYDLRHRLAVLVSGPDLGSVDVRGDRGLFLVAFDAGPEADRPRLRRSEVEV